MNKQKKMNALDVYLRTHGITQLEFSKKINATPSHLSCIIRGKHIPSLSTAYAIEKATNHEVTVYEWVEHEIEEALQDIDNRQQHSMIKKI